VLTVVLVFAANNAQAVEALDQQNDVGMSATADTATPFSQEVGQTFTVGVAGTLSRIELQINRMFGSDGSAILTVYNTTGGVPNASLGTASLSTALIPPGTYAYQSFDISSFAILVNLGDVLAYGIRSSGEAGYALRSTFTSDTYAGGETKWRGLGPPPGAWNSFSPSHDNGFKTYVNATDSITTPGDFNDDGVVTAADYVIWRKHFNSPSEAALNGNGDNQNGIDVGDYNLWQEHFATGSGGAGGAVPEPEAMTLGILAALNFLSGTRRRSGGMRALAPSPRPPAHV
jgi:hypothetical protein